MLPSQVKVAHYEYSQQRSSGEQVICCMGSLSIVHLKIGWQVKGLVFTTNMEYVKMGELPSNYGFCDLNESLIVHI